MLSGRLTVAQLQNDPVEACMVDAGEERNAEECHPVVQKLPLEESALSQAQRARAVPLALEVSINAEGILDPCARSAGSTLTSWKTPWPLTMRSLN